METTTNDEHVPDGKAMGDFFIARVSVDSGWFLQNGLKVRLVHVEGIQQRWLTFREADCGDSRGEESEALESSSIEKSS